MVVLGLRHPAGGQLADWQLGAHIDLLLEPGLARQFSLCGDPADRRTWRIGVLRETAGRGGSRYVHDKLGPGSAVRVRGPRSHFRFAPAPRYLFIAGGIGITPILPMLAAAEARCSVWPDGALRVERFAPRAADPGAARTAFEVELAQSGLTLTVAPDASILRTVEAAGVPVLSSCTAGGPRPGREPPRG